MKNNIEDLLLQLKQSPPIRNIFNPWRDVDVENDISPDAPEIRTNHLRRYLEARVKRARYLLIGEALGYQGGHFSGIAMTSERILLGYKKGEGINPEHVLPNFEPKRTSKPEIKPKGFSEPTASIVWGTLLRHGLNPNDFVLWNVFPWHPFDQNKGVLSNRRPSEKELKYGYPILTNFLELFPEGRIIALGKISANTLKSIRIHCYEVRHPANGGAREFKNTVKFFL